MDTKLSESTIAVLRFEIKGYRAKDPTGRLPAYRELAAAGIMEPTSESEFRFTEYGLAHREGILDREAGRIERERFEPPDRNLSRSARERLRLHLAGDDAVTEENRAAYRELVAARVMTPVHSFAGGREAVYRFTYWGFKLRFEILGCVKEGA